MPVVQISSALPPVISGGTSSLFSDIDVHLSSPLTRRRRRIPLFDDDEDDEEEEDDDDAAEHASGSGRARAYNAAKASVTFQDLDEDDGDEGAHTLTALGTGSVSSSSTITGIARRPRIGRLDSSGSFVGSDPGVSNLDMDPDRERRSSVAGPSSASSSSLKVISRSASLRIVSRAAGAPGSSSLADHFDPNDQRIRRVGAKGSSSLDLSHGSGRIGSSLAGNRGSRSGEGEGSMSLSSLGGVGGVRAFGSSLSRASPIPVPVSSSTSSSSSRDSSDSSSSNSSRPRPPPLESINTSIHSSGSSLSDREQLPSAGGMSSTTTGTTSSSRTSTSSSDAAVFSLRSLGSHRNSTDSSISSLNDELGGTGGNGLFFSADGLGAFVRSAKGKQKVQVQTSVLEQWDESDRTSVAGDRDVDQELEPGQQQWLENDADTETATSPSTVQADHPDPVADSISTTAGIDGGVAGALAVDTPEPTPSEATLEPVQSETSTSSVSAETDILSASSPLDLRHPPQALQIPTIKDAMSFLNAPSSPRAQPVPEFFSETASSSTDTARPMMIDPSEGGLLTLPAGQEGELQSGRQGRHSISPRRFSDRIRPTPSPDVFDQRALPDEQPPQQQQQTEDQSLKLSVETGATAQSTSGSLSMDSIPRIGGTGSTSAYGVRSPGIPIPLALPTTTTSSSLVGPSSGTRAAVSGASYAYGYGYDSSGHGQAHAGLVGDAYGEAHLPRRHSGIFLQRTRSALSIGRRPDVSTSFGGGGHGHHHLRAGRKGASSTTSRSGGQGVAMGGMGGGVVGSSSHLDAVWDQGSGSGSSAAELQADFWASAPFSALEARNRAFGLTKGTAGGQEQLLFKDGPGPYVSSISGLPRNTPWAIAVSQPASPRVSAFTPSMGALLSPSMLRSGFIGGFNFTPLPAAIAPAAGPGKADVGATKLPAAGVDVHEGSSSKSEEREVAADDDQAGAKNLASDPQARKNVNMAEFGVMQPSSLSMFSTVPATSSSSSLGNMPTSTSTNSTASSSSSGSRSIAPSRRGSRLVLPPLEERRAITPDEIEAAAARAHAANGGGTAVSAPATTESFLAGSVSHPIGFGWGHARSHHHVHALSGPAGVSARPLPLAIAVPSPVVEAPAVLGGAGAGAAEARLPVSAIGMGVRPLTLVGLHPGSPLTAEPGETLAVLTNAGTPVGESGGGSTVLPTRPVLTRAMTNVHYTPTTEEWSRFLARQGVGLSPHPSPSAASVSGASTGRNRTRSSRISNATDGSGSASARMSTSISSLRSGEEGRDEARERERERESSLTAVLAPGSERMASKTFSSSSSSSATTTPTATTDSDRMSPISPMHLDHSTRERRVREDTNETTVGADSTGPTSLYALRSPFEVETDRFQGVNAGFFPAGSANEHEDAGGEGLSQSSAAGNSVGVMERIKALSRTWSASAINSVLPQDLARSLVGTSLDSFEAMASDLGEGGPSGSTSLQHLSGSYGANADRSRAHSRSQTAHIPSAPISTGGMSPSSSRSSSYLSENDDEDDEEDVDDDEPLHALQAAVSRSPSVSGGLGSGAGAGAGSGSFAGLMGSASASTPRIGTGGATVSSPMLMPQGAGGALSSTVGPRSPDRHWDAGFLGVSSSPISRRNQSSGNGGGSGSDITLMEDAARTDTAGERSADNTAQDDELMYSCSPTLFETAPLPVGQGGPGTTRSIDDFVVIEEIGRGAYGLVKKVRLRGPDGRPNGHEPYIIKFIIKSRILADCWRRHKTLGPIPIEIHVLDQLRRIPFIGTENGEEPPWAPSRLFDSLPSDDAQAHARRRPSSGFASTTVEEVQTAGGGEETVRQRTRSLASHPALCEMVEFFEDHEFYYLVMPCFGQGQDLFDFVEAAPEGLPSAQVRSILGQVADALRHLHANNIVHRDIKDENVVLDGLGNAQLIDFGSAAHVRPGRLFDTFSGTLDYAAAEILRGEKYGGKEQDVWALGVVAYVLLCGETPFWNGEEAIAGLTEGTRASAALKDRCALHWHPHEDEPSSDVQQQDQQHEASSSTDTSPAAKVVVSMMSNNEEAPETETDAELRARAGRDHGQPDGGGRVMDGADLIRQCLQLELDKRPTAEQVCSHRFLVGEGTGWVGECGWTRVGQIAQ